MEITQVIVNLITNSVQAFTNRNIENKNVNIDCYSKDDKNYITIEDNAGGIGVKFILEFD